jgi:chromosome segregation ATPase
MGEREESPRGNRGRSPDLDHFERLERLVRDLVERHVALRREHASLRHTLGEREARLRSMDARVRELNQVRQDAVKRIDDLVSQLERVEQQLDRRQGSAAEAS